MSEEANQLHLRSDVGNRRVWNPGVDERAVTLDDSLRFAVLPQHSLAPDDEDDLLARGVEVGGPAVVPVELHDANREGVVLHAIERVDHESPGPRHVVVGGARDDHLYARMNSKGQ